ncbi:putative nuclease HARBI1 [Colias croceus]|uniref:putative nuclease HARBI1 n=1 Tax=Colias crocea TaxID=72248 RepID=UPI001E28189E|nr:putative nuclease HARBI1 [Colias croceus]
MDMNDTLIDDFTNDVQEISYFSIRRRQRKHYKQRVNPLDLDEEEFRSRYRFGKHNMQQIINLVRDDLRVDTRGGGIPVELQVMAVIRYWGRHEIQEDCADIHGMSQQTLSRLSRNVAIALASKSSRYINMPSNSTEEAKAIRKFEVICGMKRIIGAIDCTHIKIRKVSGEAGQYYVNRKGHYSINTQVVCDSDLKICDIVCHWRGSTHDSRIYRESSIKRRFEQNEFHGKLIGDSGYPCTSHLLTPILRPRTQAEERYNLSHVRTRNTVERCFGVWKQRFRILNEPMRGSLQVIKTTIVACAVLHNLAILFNESILNQDPGLENQLLIEPTVPDNIQHEDENINRAIYIETYFNQ